MRTESGAKVWYEANLTLSRIELEGIIKIISMIKDRIKKKISETLPRNKSLV